MKLTDKQQRFVEEYLVDLNATQAAIRAGYSKKTAKDIGSQNLAKLYIRNAIDKQRRKLSEKAEISVVWVMQELRRVYERCMQCIPAQDKNGEAILVHVPKDLIADYGDTVTVMAPFHPSAANKALELIGRHLGAFPTKVEVTGKDGKDFSLMPKFDTPAKEIVRQYLTLRLQVNEMDESTIREAMQPFEKMFEAQAQRRNT